MKEQTSRLKHFVSLCYEDELMSQVDWSSSIGNAPIKIDFS